MTGGHTDEHQIPLHIAASRDWEGLGDLCDGVPECLKAVRKNLRMQADVIKVVYLSIPFSPVLCLTLLPGTPDILR